jgi:hypothetical protein
MCKGCCKVGPGFESWILGLLQRRKYKERSSVVEAIFIDELKDSNTCNAQKNKKKHAWTECIFEAFLYKI